MPLCKTNGNMYPWVTHMHTHLAGECPHCCSYCYVQDIARAKAQVRAKYSGELRLVEKEFAVNYGEGKTIFVEHLNDLWAARVCRKMRERVLAHCNTWPRNTYVFQTKNPEGYLWHRDLLPPCRLMGVTIETNRETSAVSQAPHPAMRALYVRSMLHRSEARFVTIEPVMDFDLEPMLAMVLGCRPHFVNVGADSKGHGLPEPRAEKVAALLDGMRSVGLRVYEKPNLKRIMG